MKNPSAYLGAILFFSCQCNGSQARKISINSDEISEIEIAEKIINAPTLLKTAVVNGRYPLDEWICGRNENDLLQKLLDHQKQIGFELTPACTVRFFRVHTMGLVPEYANFAEGVLQSSRLVDILKDLLITYQGLRQLSKENIADMMIDATLAGSISSIVYLLEIGGPEIEHTQNLQESIVQSVKYKYWRICKLFFAKFKARSTEYENIAKVFFSNSWHDDFLKWLKQQKHQGLDVKKIEATYALCCETSRMAYRNTLKILTMDADLRRYLSGNQEFRNKLKKFDPALQALWLANKL